MTSHSKQYYKHPMTNLKQQTDDLALDIIKSMQQQGFEVTEAGLKLKPEQYRHYHLEARNAHLQSDLEFIMKNRQLGLSGLADKPIAIDKIKPVLRRVVTRKEHDFLRWILSVWWSLPHTPSVGRSLKYIVWDEYHNSAMGVLTLNSPTINVGIVKNHLEIPKDESAYWINKSMNGMRVGALPPYRDFLGSRFIASLLTCKELRDDYKKVYGDDMLFTTTTAINGKSAVYDRHRYQDQKTSWFLGYTKGYGLSHFMPHIYAKIKDYLTQVEPDKLKQLQSGRVTNRKMRIIQRALQHTGLKHLTFHSIKRGFYLFTTCNNLKAVIHKNEEPDFTDISIQQLCDFWRERWVKDRYQSPHQHNAIELMDKQHFNIIDKYAYNLILL